MTVLPVPPVDRPDDVGLTEMQAAARLQEDGYNEVLAKRADSLASILARQLTDTVIVVLLVAALLTALVRDVPDTVVILAVVVLNTALGAVQEARSGRALVGLAELTAPRATVVRERVVRDIEAREVVRGDVLRLAAGDIVAADGTASVAQSLLLDESVLTGESVPVVKTPGEQVYAGTVVTRGRGEIRVSMIGASTAMGGIARSLADADQTLTPVQRQLAVLGRRLAIAVSIAAAIVAALNLVTGHGVETSLVLAISLAVAAIPESLPAVVSLSLSMAAGRMTRRGVLARKLAAVEALGSVTVIATDKTGTLTEGRMALTDTWTPAGDAAARMQLLRMAALCCDAYRSEAEHPGQRDDPLEVAIVDAARAQGIDIAALRMQYPRIAEQPFDAELARMTTTHRAPNGCDLVITKGAPEVLLAQLPDADAAAAQEVVEHFTAAGRRALAVTVRGGDSGTHLLGLLALADPIRATAPTMLNAFLQAGVRPIMITGDHPQTARAVAEQLGVMPPGGAVGTAEQLSSVGDLRVFARVRPEQKTAIIEELRRRGDVVAMTGDGVNDAPALRAADIGIAMGRGTEVAKQAAALVLTSDDLSAMVPAIAEGRRVYDNLRRFLHYALSGGVAEVLIMMFGPLLGLAIPLQAGQILWVNLLTHGLPGVAMGNEPAAADVLTRLPRRPGAALLDRATVYRVAVLASVIAAATLLSGGWSALAHRPAQSTIFLTLTFAQLAAGLALRPKSDGRNRMLVGAVVLNVALAVLAVSWGPLRELLRTEPLAAADYLPALVAALAVALVARWQSRRANAGSVRSTPGDHR